MIETLKLMVQTMLFIGIFVVVLELIIPKSNNNKYIYTLVGIIIIITIVSPLNSLLNNEIDFEEFFKGFETETTFSDIESKDLIKEEFINNFKLDIETKLKENNVNVKEIYIKVDEEYNIIDLNITISKIENSEVFENITDVVKYINSEYELDYSKIEVMEEGI